MNNWNRIWKPIVVLSLICVVVTGALAATNEVTAPIIEEATIAAENAARAEVLPEADSFSPVEGITVEGVSAVYTADNGAGAAITASAKGYGGDVVVMVGINADGNIEGITVTQQTETKGIGSNVVDNPEYLAQYSGLSAAEPLVLNEDVDARTSATVSSTAVINAVNAAIEAYNQIP